MNSETPALYPLERLILLLSFAAGIGLLYWIAHGTDTSFWKLVGEALGTALLLRTCAATTFPARTAPSSRTAWQVARLMLLYRPLTGLKLDLLAFLSAIQYRGKP